MRLPVILASITVAGLVAIALGLYAGFGGWQTVLFVAIVIVVVQFAHVGLVAALAMRNRRRRQASEPQGAPRESTRMSRRRDT